MNEYVMYGFLKGIKRGNEIEIKSIKQIGINGDYSKGYTEGRLSVLIEQNKRIKSFMKSVNIRIQN